jgi:hypothetical protein
MTELNETAPPPAGFGVRHGRTGAEAGRLRKPPPLVVRGATFSQLTQTVEAEIIPRLVMAHAHAAPQFETPAILSGEIDVARFAEMMLRGNGDEAANRSRSTAITARHSKRSISTFLSRRRVTCVISG